MKLRRVSVALMVLLLAIPAATAYGADQQVSVHVLPADTLSIQVDGQIDFGGLVPGQTGHYDFWLNIVNTTTSGWEVTVTGDDLYSFNWENCSPQGCWNPIPTDPLFTIDKSNLVVTGGDLGGWDGEDPTGDTIRPFSGSPGDSGTPTTIVQGTSFATGEFGLDNPRSSLELTIPLGAEQLQQYRTDLVYTIMAWAPAP